MINLGNVNKGDNVTCPFYSTTVLGLPITMVGGAIEVHESNNPVGITAGITFDADLFGTGSHHVMVDTSNAAYSKGTNYTIKVSAGTVDGVSMIGYVVGYFSCENRIVEGIKKNTALPNFTFFMADSSDGRSPALGVTVTSSVKIDAGAFGSTANSVSEVGNGVYVIDLAASDLNGDMITLKMTGTGADGRYITIKTNTG